MYMIISLALDMQVYSAEYQLIAVVDYSSLVPLNAYFINCQYKK